MDDIEEEEEEDIPSSSDVGLSKASMNFLQDVFEKRKSRKRKKQNVEEAKANKKKLEEIEHERKVASRKKANQRDEDDMILKAIEAAKRPKQDKILMNNHWFIRFLSSCMGRGMNNVMEDCFHTQPPDECETFQDFYDYLNPGPRDAYEAVEEALLLATRHRVKLEDFLCGRDDFYSKDKPLEKYRFLLFRSLVGVFALSIRGGILSNPQQSAPTKSSMGYFYKDRNENIKGLLRWTKYFHGQSV
jgi:hypothetical protein